MLLKMFPDKTLFEPRRRRAGLRLRFGERLLSGVMHGSSRPRELRSSSSFDALTKAPGVDWPDWTKVEGFHLDEYVGLPATHPASFRKFLMERLVSKTGIVEVSLDRGGRGRSGCSSSRRWARNWRLRRSTLPSWGLERTGTSRSTILPRISRLRIRIIIVNLDEPCRRQQVGEGWFADISQVPERAISMSARQILKAKEIVAVVPDARKAQAVKACLEGEISPLAPASILRRHGNAVLYLDKDSSSQLSASLQRERAEESRTPVSF
jgi:glucosamine-6-phosphate deaminase